MLGARSAVALLAVLLTVSTVGGLADSVGPEDSTRPARTRGGELLASLSPISQNVDTIGASDLRVYDPETPGIFGPPDRSLAMVADIPHAGNPPLLDATVTIVTDPSGLDVIVNGTRSATPVSFVGPPGATVTIGAPSPQQVGPGTRYVWTSWSDLGDATHVITISGSTMLVARFQTEYRLTVDSPVPGSAGDRWYPSGMRAYARVAYALFDVAPGERLVFFSWSGDASGEGTTSGPILMNGPKVAVAIYGRQFLLEVQTPYGTSVGSRWHTPGARAYALVTPSRVQVGTGARQVFAGWSGDASGSTVLSDPILMDGPKWAVATWRAEFLVAVESQFAGVQGEGWHVAGSVATLRAPPQVVSGPFIYTFAGWTGDIASPDPTVTVPVDRPLTVTATWALLGAFGPFLSILAAAGAAVAAVVIVFWKRRRRSRSLGGEESGR